MKVTSEIFDGTEFKVTREDLNEITLAQILSSIEKLNLNRITESDASENTFSTSISLPFEGESITSHSKTKLLGSGLVKLQSEGAIIIKEEVGLRDRKYRHLVEMYLWWKTAKEVDGYLENQYKKLERDWNANVKLGVNFRPLLWLVYSNTTLSDYQLREDTDMLNFIRMEHEKRSELYAKDAASKLVNFIKKSGGLDGLRNKAGIKVKNNDDKNKSTDKDSTKNEIESLLSQLSVIKKKEEKEKLEADARQFFDNMPGNLKATANSYIISDDTGIGLLLVKRNSTGVDIISSCKDSNIIKLIMTNEYRRRFDAIPRSTRSILELLFTQCVPKHLEHLAFKLRDKNKLESKGRKVQSVPRVLFMHQVGEFILSPTNSSSGVVSIIKPKTTPFNDIKHDVFMPTRLTESISRKLLRDYLFNLYEPSNTQYIPEVSNDGNVSHLITLINRADQEDIINLEIWPFTNTLNDFTDQVVVDDSQVGYIVWQADLSHDWFQKLVHEFINPWMYTLGRNITRENNALIQITFCETGLKADYSYRNGKFENNWFVDFDNVLDCHQSSQALFRTKELMTVFRSIAELCVLGEVILTLYDDLLRISFETDGDSGCEHTIYIPTVDIKGNHSTRPFLRYKPIPIVEIICDDLLNLSEFDEGSESSLLGGTE